MPYAGFSAAAVVAAGAALVGGWPSRGTPVCAEEASEYLAEIEVRPGLGRVHLARAEDADGTVSLRAYRAGEAFALER